MGYTKALAFDIKWNYKTISLFLILLALPNLLGVVNIATPWGFKLHTFQLAVFIASLVYGPWGGMLSGTIGSMYSALSLSNPYIIVGNAILGFFTGYFFKEGKHTVAAVLLAYLIQLPWLIITDYYLVHLPLKVIRPLIVALLISNILWAIVAHNIFRPVKNFLNV